MHKWTYWGEIPTSSQIIQEVHSEKLQAALRHAQGCCGWHSRQNIVLLKTYNSAANFNMIAPKRYITSKEIRIQISVLA